MLVKGLDLALQAAARWAVLSLLLQIETLTAQIALQLYLSCGLLSDRNAIFY